MPNVPVLVNPIIPDRCTFYFTFILAKKTASRALVQPDQPYECTFDQDSLANSCAHWCHHLRPEPNATDGLIGGA